MFLNICKQIFHIIRVRVSHKIKGVLMWDFTFKSNVCIKLKYTLISLDMHLFLYKQLGSGFSPQSCLCFQGFWRSKLLNGCLVVTKSKVSTRNTSIFKIQNQYLWSSILKLFQQCFWDSLILVYFRFNRYFTFITKEKIHFSFKYTIKT